MEVKRAGCFGRRLSLAAAAGTLLAKSIGQDEGAEERSGFTAANTVTLQKPASGNSGLGRHSTVPRFPQADLWPGIISGLPAIGTQPHTASAEWSDPGSASELVSRGNPAELRTLWAGFPAE